MFSNVYFAFSSSSFCQQTILLSSQYRKPALWSPFWHQRGLCWGSSVWVARLGALLGVWLFMTPNCKMKWANLFFLYTVRFLDTLVGTESWQHSVSSLRNAFSYLQNIHPFCLKQEVLGWKEGWGVLKEESLFWEGRWNQQWGRMEVMDDQKHWWLWAAGRLGRNEGRNLVRKNDLRRGEEVRIPLDGIPSHLRKLLPWSRSTQLIFPWTRS